MTSYPETLTVKKLITIEFFIINIYYISSSNDPNITHTKNHTWSHTLNVSLFAHPQNIGVGMQKNSSLDRKIVAQQIQKHLWFSSVITTRDWRPVAG
jgi:hypothetical protein